MPELPQNAKIVGREELSEDLAIFQILPSTPLAHCPGQYATLGLSDGLGHNVKRAMSIASPAGARVLEFFIRKVAQPRTSIPFTHLLFNRRLGDPIYMRPKPAGHFTLEHTSTDDSKTKLLIGAGTGVAPFISMIRSRTDVSDLILLQGARCARELGFKRALEAQRGLRYIPTISRPSSSPDWSGAVGRVEAHLQPDRIDLLETDLQARIQPAHVDAFVCGPSGTVASTIAALLPLGFLPAGMNEELGLPPQQAPSLFYERYDATPLFDAQTLAGLRATVTKLF